MGVVFVLGTLSALTILAGGASNASNEGISPAESDARFAVRDGDGRAEPERIEGDEPRGEEDAQDVAGAADSSQSDGRSSPLEANDGTLERGDEERNWYVFKIGSSEVATPYVVSVDVVAFPGSPIEDGASDVVSFVRTLSRAYVRERPSAGATIFGVIPEETPFAIIGEPFEGEGCRKGMWHQVEVGGYACLRLQRATQEGPSAFPHFRKNKSSPLFFVRPLRAKDGEEAHEFPRYHSWWKMRRDEVEDHLIGYGTYGFVKLKRGVFTDIEGRTVRNEHFRRFSPSRFEGAVLSEVTPAGIPEGQTLAWTFESETFVYGDTGRWARKRRELKKHTAILVPSGPPEVVRGEAWLPFEDGWIRAAKVRRWQRISAPEEMGVAQKWIDVDLDEQILTMYEGAEPVFATLVTTGRGGESRTPVGTFEIGRKKNIGDMKSSDGVRRPYFVGDVPWIQFFHEGYALHSTYWHNRFGKTGSHGCVNLSLKDAARLFEWTTPEVPAGWNWRFLRDGERGLGTTIMIRSAKREAEQASSEDEPRRKRPAESAPEPGPVESSLKP